MLEFSPDWDARLCYLVVLGCAVISARVQVLGRLEILKQKIVYAWGQRSTWLVFTIYLLLPLVLFWFLDRTGAMKDTSVFAALLVGLAYPAILSGSTNIKPAEGLAGAFGWLNKAVDGIAAKTTAMVALDAQLFERVLVDHLVKDDKARAHVQELALQYAQSRDAATAELDAKKNDPRAQAQIIYDYATGSALGLKPITRLLPKLGVKVSSPYNAAIRSIWIYGIFAAIIALALLVLVFMHPVSLHYYTWRAIKPGVSDHDLYRTRNVLGRFLADADDTRAGGVRLRLVGALQQPGLESKRADQILQLIIAGRGDPMRSRFIQIPRELTTALRVDSVDIRARIHHALLFLADELIAAETNAIDKKTNQIDLSQVRPALDSLRGWTPLATESPIDLERIWQAWSNWWNLVGKAPSPPL